MFYTFYIYCTVIAVILMLVFLYVVKHIELYHPDLLMWEEFDATLSDYAVALGLCFVPFINTFIIGLILFVFIGLMFTDDWRFR